MDSRSPPSSSALSREAAPSALRVLSDASLLHVIGSFQSGIPPALRQFWTRHDPKAARKRPSYQDASRLIRLVVSHGSPHHLELIAASRFRRKGEWRAPSFTLLPLHAVQTGRVDIFRWVLANGLELGKPQYLWRAAVERHDDMAMLELLQQTCPLSDAKAQQLFDNTFLMPTATLLQWISARYPFVVFPPRFVDQAVANEDLALLSFMLEYPLSRGCGNECFRTVYKSKFYDGLECLIAHCGGEMTSDVVEELVRDTSGPIQDIVRRHPVVFASTVRKLFREGVINGHSLQMRHLYATGMIDTVSVDDAASWKGLAGLKYLHRLGLARATTEAMDSAAESYRWDVVSFLHTNRIEGCTTRAADAAVKSGDLKRVRFFLESRNEGCSAAAMNRTAAHGSMEMLRYLHDHSKAGCTSEAMDVAAARGRLHVVRFLHENRSEGCTTAAIDNAARGGYIKIVKLLCKHRKEGCTVAGIKAALKNHHADVVHVLHKHHPHLFDADLLYDLLLRGAFKTFMKLRDEYPEEADSVLERVMFEAGKQLELRTIWFILKELGRSDLGQLAVEGAACLKSGETAQWQQALEIITTSGYPEYAASSSQWWLNPLLWDARTPTWAVRMIFVDWQVDCEIATGASLPLTWAVHGVYRRDITLLQALRDLPPTVIGPLGANPCPPPRGLWTFRFEGARTAAIHMGDRAILEWLLTNVELPIEPTLLSEAVYHHQFEIAEWLVATHPAACTQLDWTKKGSEFRSVDYGLYDGLLDWLESHDSVRQALSFIGIIDFAARTNDVASLRRLYAWYPELFTPRPSLVELSDLESCRGTINFLLEIGWCADVFVDANGD